jgi:Flp pilus assembly protein TadB
MLEAFLLLCSGVGFMLIVYAGRRAGLRRRAQERLAAALPAVEEEEQPPPPVRPVLRRHRLLPWLVAVALAAGLHFFVGLHLTFAGAAGVIVGLLGGQLETYLAGRKLLRVEAQLADAIDLMVGALRAGAGVLHALDAAARESHAPLRPQLEDVLGRIRFGDDPQAVLRALVARVPLEPFRLFAAALAVHWEVGGSLAPTLATVGRTIRDRVDVSRRIRSLTTEARASIVAVVLVTAFLGLVMWRSNPDRMEQFLTTTLGRGLVTFAVLLQAVGIVWSASISRVRY